jgi:hypothetical protein
MHRPETSSSNPPRTPPGLIAALIVGGLMLLAMIVLLALTLGVLSDSRSHIEAQDAKVTRLLELSKPSLQEAKPLAAEAKPVLRQAEPLVRAASRALPGIKEASRDGAFVLDRLPVFMQAGQALFHEASPALDAIAQSQLGPSLAAVRTLAAQMLEGDRLAATLDSARALTDRVSALDLPGRAVRSAHRLARLLNVQVRAYRKQKNTLSILRQSLRIQQETLRHVRSLDTKTGGTLPPVP